MVEDLKKYESSGQENEKQANSTRADILTEMPTFEEMRRLNQVPEGVRDEQDYREYLAEKTARESEALAEEEKTKAEKIEKIGTLEKRIALNEGIYDRAAFARAYLLEMDPDKYERQDYFGQQSGFLMGYLYNAIAEDNIDDLEIVHLERQEGHKAAEWDEFVIKKGDEEYISELLGGVANFGDKIDEEGRNYDLARERMDTKEYEQDIERFLSKEPERINSYDLKDIEDEISTLQNESNLFKFGESGGTALQKGKAIIPTLEARLRLEEQVLNAKKKIAEVASQVKEREYQAAINSRDGQRVMQRTKNNEAK